MSEPEIHIRVSVSAWWFFALMALLIFGGAQLSDAIDSGLNRVVQECGRAQ